MFTPRDPARASPASNQSFRGDWRMLPLAMTSVLPAAGRAHGSTGPTLVSAPVVVTDPPLPDGGTLGAMLTDALVRAQPALPEGASRKEMATALGQLSLVLETKSVSAVKLAHAAAEAAIANYELVAGDETSALAELGGIRLALGVIASELAALTGE